MDNFKAVYKILSTLEKSMDLPEADLESIDHKALDISKERWCRYIEMMLDVGYIKGASVLNDPPKMVYRSTEYRKMAYI